VDEISTALAVALAAIEQHSSEERYSEPALAAWIQSVRSVMADLQLFLDGLPGADSEPSPGTRPRTLGTAQPKTDRPICPACGGTGVDDSTDRDCKKCHGSGRVGA
jgi:hypothetical protein